MTDKKFPDDTPLFAYEEPVTRPEDSAIGGTRTTHPAYGQIVANRVGGGLTLYGSDVVAPACVSITIARSEMCRSLSRDWPFARQELIEVMLTEAQWAAFVSGLNIGSGPCCTIQHIEGKRVPRIPEPKESKTDLFEAEIKQTVGKLFERLNDLAKKLPEGPMTKTKVEELRKELRYTAQHLSGNIPFVANQFTEHMENEVEKAKMEVNAYVTQTLMRAGLEHLTKKLPEGEVVEQPALPAPNKE